MYKKDGSLNPNIKCVKKSSIADDVNQCLGGDAELVKVPAIVRGDGGGVGGATVRQKLTHPLTPAGRCLQVDRCAPAVVRARAGAVDDALDVAFFDDVTWGLAAGLLVVVLRTLNWTSKRDR